jgi:hypothetical protein
VPADPQTLESSSTRTHYFRLYKMPLSDTAT